MRVEKKPQATISHARWGCHKPSNIHRMEEKTQKKISKFLSFVLRHQPEHIGISLDKNGWADVADLILKMQSQRSDFDFEQLDLIVRNNNKQRFAFNEDKTRIRASQGHSIEVDLELTAQIPPKELYHGTGEKYTESILTIGLIKKDRNHVHLSPDKETALQVGKRHGKPILFVIDSDAMHQDGFAFFHSQNGVWLTDSVPIKYMKKL
jgi:putative RNA 2'-phosphotransferase